MLNLELVGEDLTAEVIDDGSGITQEVGASSDSQALRILGERLSGLNGGAIMHENIYQDGRVAGLKVCLTIPFIQQ